MCVCVCVCVCMYMYVASYVCICMYTLVIAYIFMVVHGSSTCACASQKLWIVSNSPTIAILHRQLLIDLIHLG